MEKNILLYILLIFTSCNNSPELSDKLIKNSNGDVYIALIDGGFKEKTFALTKEEVLKINSIITKKVVKEIEQSDIADIYYLEYKEKLKIELEKYKRQYCAYFNDKGEKEVYVNCFCRTVNDSWKTKLYRVSGGGKCYFSGVINISTGQIQDFMINAPK